MDVSLSLQFTNYTFESLVTIIAAILGIGYPLFLENIRKIGEQYHSSLILENFQRERCWKCYQWILPITIVYSLVLPFVMFLCANGCLNFYLLLVYTILMATVVFVLLWLFNVIQRYYNPAFLIECLYKKYKASLLMKQDMELRKILFSMVDVLYYTSVIKDGKGFERSLHMLGNIFSQEMKQCKSEEFNVSSPLYMACQRIIDYSDASQKSFSLGIFVSGKILTSVTDKHIGHKNYELLWYEVCHTINNPNSDAFYRYWQQAVQYYPNVLYVIEHNTGEKYSVKHDQTFREWHYMIGANVIYNERYDLLNIMFTYSNYYPLKIDLVPNTFSTVMVELTNILRNHCVTGNSLYANMHFESGMDNVIFEYVYRYYALLIIQLFSWEYILNSKHMDDAEYKKNVVRFAPPTILSTTNYENLVFYQTVAQNLIAVIEWWYDSKSVQSVNLKFIPSKEKVVHLFENHMNNINTLIEAINNK